MKTQTCTAELIEATPLTNSILQLKLKPEKFVDYLAGQYLKIKLKKEAISYSIANAPLGVHHYELHIRHSGGDPFKQPLFSHFKQVGNCTIELPFGDCFVDKLEKEKPIIFIAGGTGFAPIKAMIEEMLARDDQRNMTLFWGAREACDIYQQNLVDQWQKHVINFNVKTLIDNKKQSRLANEILKMDDDFLSTAQFVISGPFPLVYGIRDQLVHFGLRSDRMYSDAFAFEK